MTKGTPSMGLKSGKRRFVTRCRRCGNRSYSVRKKICSSCEYGKTATMRSYAWQKKKRTKKKQIGA